MLPAFANLPDAYRGDSYGPIKFEFYDADSNPILLDSVTDVKCCVGSIGSDRDRKIVLKWPETTHNYSLSANVLTLGTVSSQYMKMKPEIYYWDLEITMNGYTRTYLAGNFTVKDEVANY